MKDLQVEKKLISFTLLISVCLSMISAALILLFSAAADNTSFKITASSTKQGGDFASATEISILSVNLMEEETEFDTESAKLLFGEYSADIVCLQEVSERHTSFISYLCENGYTLSNAEEISSAPILFKSDRFEAVSGNNANGNISLSSCDEECGILTWTVPNLKSDDRNILVLSTQFSDGIDTDTDKTLTDNSHEVLSLLSEIYSIHGHIPTVLAGDFNMQSNEAAHRILLGKFYDAFSIATNRTGIESSYNPQYKEGCHVYEENYPTDRIYVSKNDFSVTSYKTVRKDYTLSLSDHYPIFATVALSSLPVPKASFPDCIHDGEITVSLEAEQVSGIRIFYTLDSNDPRKNGTEYTSPFSVCGSVMLKAVTEKDGKYSDILTVNYVSENDSPIVITRVIQNSYGRDLYEGFEIVNVSDSPIDLFDYRVFYESADTKEELDKAPINTFSRNMPLSDVKGLYVLGPGQIAYVCTFFADHYTESANGGYKAVSKDIDLNVIYNTDAIRKAYRDQNGKEIPSDVLIVPIDRTSASYFKNGQVTNLSGSFNMDNARYAEISIAFSHAEDPSRALASVSIPKSTKEGAHVYIPTDSVRSEHLGSTDNCYSIGMYTPEQYSALTLIMKDVPSNFSDKLITNGNESQETTRPTDSTFSTESTSAPSVTTLHEVTTVNSSTSAPVTSSPPPDTASPPVSSKPQTTGTSSPKETTAPVSSSTSAEATAKITTAVTTRDPDKTTAKRTTSSVTTKAPNKETSIGTSNSQGEATTTSSLDRDSSFIADTVSPDESTAIPLPERKIPELEIFIVSATTLTILACVTAGIILIVRENKKQ